MVLGIGSANGDIDRKQPVSPFSQDQCGVSVGNSNRNAEGFTRIYQKGRLGLPTVLRCVGHRKVSE